MATIWKTAKGELIHHGPDVEPVLSRDLFGQAVEVCSVCGQPQAVAWWCGTTILAVCRPCALHVLRRSCWPMPRWARGHRRQGAAGRCRPRDARVLAGGTAGRRTRG